MLYDQYFIDDLKKRAHLVRRLCLFIVGFGALIGHASAQESPKPVLVEEVGETCVEYLMAVFDAFRLELDNHPTSEGLILVHGNRATEGRSRAYVRWLDRYPTTRLMDTSRLVVIRAADREDLKIEFWRLPAGAERPKFDPYSPKDWTSRTQMFDRAWAEFNRDEGELAIFSNSFFDLGCYIWPDSSTYAMILSVNPSLNGVLVVYARSRTGKRAADRVSRFARDYLIRLHRVPASRIKTIYGGERENGEIEFWLVPPGGDPPPLIID